MPVMDVQISLHYVSLRTIMEFERESLTSQQIANKVLAATVLLVMKDDRNQPLGFGSGFFVQPNRIATNFHVIDGASQGIAKRVGQEATYTIEGVNGVDQEHDLAILQVSASEVQPLPFANSEAIEIGDEVYVAGNPMGFDGTFSDGIISGIRGCSADKLLQMTAPISPGSSGGPVLNNNGEVIGVSVATIEGGQNLNFAIPVNYLRTLLNQCAQAQPSLQGNQSISAETYYRWADTMFSLQRYQEAILMYDLAITLKPDYTVAYNNRGLAKNNLELYDAAIADYNSAINLKHDFAEAYNNRGLALSNLEQYDSAIVDYDRAIDLKQDYAIAYNNRGLAKNSRGQLVDAIADYNAAINLKPDFAEAYYNRGIATRTRQDLQTGLQLAQQSRDNELRTTIESALHNLYLRCR